MKRLALTIFLLFLTGCRCLDHDCRRMEQMERRAVRHAQWWEGKR
jgi:hypothetical protein